MHKRRISTRSLCSFSYLCLIQSQSFRVLKLKSLSYSQILLTIHSYCRFFIFIMSYKEDILSVAMDTGEGSNWDFFFIKLFSFLCQGKEKKILSRFLWRLQRYLCFITMARKTANRKGFLTSKFSRTSLFIDRNLIFCRKSCT